VWECTDGLCRRQVLVAFHFTYYNMHFNYIIYLLIACINMMGPIVYGSTSVVYYRLRLASYAWLGAVVLVGWRSGGRCSKAAGP
jgi:hypothetical protein